MHRCYQCHGLWITVEEVQTVRSHGLLDPESLLPQKASQDHKAGLCPEGHGILTRARVELDHTSFHLERCAECQGLWFDAGEWEELASSHLIDHIDEIFDPNYQRTKRRLRLDEMYRSKLAASLGDDLMDDLDTLADRLRDHAHRGEALAYLQEKLRDGS